METQTLIHISGMFLLAAALTLAALAVLYLLQDPHLTLKLASVSWNG